MNYVATGTINIGGCSGYRLTNFFTYAFSTGSIVYSRPKAQKGIYEAVCIKEARFISWQHPPLYIDTFNAYWSEDELVPYSVAAVLVRTYLDQLAVIAESKAMNCE